MKKQKNILYVAVLFPLIAITLLCLYKIVPYLWSTVHAEQTFHNLSRQYVIPADRNIKTEDKIPDTHENVPETVSVDFASLQAINPDICAWIRFDDPGVIPIDYPILCTNDNAAFLHADIYGNYSVNGSIFLDETNNADFSDDNDPSKIIYGHNMKSGAMFGSLRKYRADDILEANQYFSIYAPEETYRYRIFSYFVTTTGSFVYQTGFSRNTENYQKYLTQLKENSMITTDTSPSADQPIVILSTCAESNSNRRFVVCGVRCED
jgi:sortase B